MSEVFMLGSEELLDTPQLFACMLDFQMISSQTMHYCKYHYQLLGKFKIEWKVAKDFNEANSEDLKFFGQYTKELPKDEFISEENHLDLDLYTLITSRGLESSFNDQFHTPRSEDPVVTDEVITAQLVPASHSTIEPPTPLKTPNTSELSPVMNFSAVNAFLACLVASASFANAHFTMTVPTPRGGSHDTMGNLPCGGYNTPSTTFNSLTNNKFTVTWTNEDPDKPAWQVNGFFGSTGATGAAATFPVSLYNGTATSATSTATIDLSNVTQAKGAKYLTMQLIVIGDQVFYGCADFQLSTSTTNGTTPSGTSSPKSSSTATGAAAPGISSSTALWAAASAAVGLVTLLLSAGVAL
ncbi:hypothetical protein BJ742DRAFT_853310 [Cladochytrium replicatum]|nr:hypothetical protein BJ742DRAFT_853310 [Cladochytrium replicatum]